MRAKILYIVCPFIALIASGCGWIGGSSGGVAVVDLDEVARQIGASEEMSQALKSREVNLNGQLQTLKANYVQQLEAKKSEFGEERSEEETTHLVAMSRQINLNLAQAQRNAQGNLNTHRAQLVAKFREQVTPYAQQIAKEKGLSVVVPKNDGLLLSVDDSVNITGDVVSALKPNWKPITVEQPKIAGGNSQSLPGAGDVQHATHNEPLPQQRR